MQSADLSEAAKAVVHRNTGEVQGGGGFEVFDELFDDDFLDHTAQPKMIPTISRWVEASAQFGSCRSIRRLWPDPAS